MNTKYILYNNESFLRLDELLRAKLPDLIGKDISNSKIRRLIVAGSVSINDRQVRVPGAKLSASSKVSVFIDEDKLFFEKQPDDIAYEVKNEDVLFEDDFIIVVNKPCFFPTEAGMVGSRDNLHAAVIRYLHGKNPSLRNPPYVGIMHRLDRETSGVILFTKSRSVNAKCHDMFEKHTAKKVYRAVVCDNGTVKNNFSVEMYMGRISPKSQAAKWGRLSESKGGLYSYTDFTLLSKKSENKTCVLECRLKTGRTHQIRVHLSSVSLPILGDTLYGGKKHERIMLHAYSLTFNHPVTDEVITVTSPLPDDFGD